MRQAPERPGDAPRPPTRPAGETRGPESRRAESRAAGAALREAAFGRPVETGLGRAAQLSFQLLLIAAAIAVAAFVVVHLWLVVVPVLVALFLATFLMPIADELRRVGVPSAAAALIAMVLALALFSGLTALLAPPVADELGDLGERVREGIGEVGSTLESIGVTEEEIDEAVDNAADTLRENSGVVGEEILSGALFVVELVAGLLLALVILFFFLKDGERMWRWFVSLLPGRRREEAEQVGRRAWWTLGRYLRGVALVATIDAVAIGAALAILGVPLVLPLAVLTFFGAFFPLVGAFTAGIVAALVALVSNGLITALIVVAVIVAVQQLEGDLIYPVVVGRAIELHPVAILAVLTAGAVTAGIIGAVFAVPATAVVWTAVKYYRGDPEEPGPREVAPSPADG